MRAVTGVDVHSEEVTESIAEVPAENERQTLKFGQDQGTVPHPSPLPEDRIVASVRASGSRIPVPKIRHACASTAAYSHEVQNDMIGKVSPSPCKGNLSSDGNIFQVAPFGDDRFSDTVQKRQDLKDVSISLNKRNLSSEIGSPLTPLHCNDELSDAARESSDKFKNSAKAHNIDYLTPPKSNSSSKPRTTVNAPLPVGEQCWSDVLELKSLVPGANSPQRQNVAGPLPPRSPLQVYGASEYDIQEQTPETDATLNRSIEPKETVRLLHEASLIDAIRFPEIGKLLDRVRHYRNRVELENPEQSKMNLEGKLSVLIYNARNLPETKRITHSADPFVQFFVAGADDRTNDNKIYHRTGIQWGSLSPTWVEQFILDLNDSEGAVVFQIMDAHKSGDFELLGQASVDIALLKDGKSHNMTLPIDFQGTLSIQWVFNSFAILR